MNPIRRNTIRVAPSASQKLKKNPTLAFSATQEEYEAVKSLAAINGISMSSILFLYGQRKVLDTALEHWEKIRKSLRSNGG